MTIRLYKVDRTGTITQDRGEIKVLPAEGPLPATSAFPPCKCPRCRTVQAVTR